MNTLNIDYDIESEWDNFMEHGNIDSKIHNDIECKNSNITPKGSDIYISTKTKITYLSQEIDLYDVFWKIQIIPYHIMQEGIVKKQMKFNFVNEESLSIVKKKLENENNVEEHIITQIKNPEGRIQFKDIRKISIGLCNKDIITYRSKKKSAFYNCFVIILRLKLDNSFKEVHVKVFNTGKLEIPGIRCDMFLDKVMDLLIKLLRPFTRTNDLTYDKSNYDTVLINSNFNCGYYINREKLYDILKYKYKINSIFDPCSYPGIQCKYLYEDYKISFMIFRTGSVLIVGKCTEPILYKIYEYIKNILEIEYNNVSVQNIKTNPVACKKKKIRKRFIYL